MFQLVKLMCISFGLLLLVSCGGVGVLDLESEGEETDLANIAIGRIVTQSSDAHGAPASLAVDGRTDGTFGNGSVTHTTDEAQPWLQLDLGSVANISEITLFNRTDCCTER